MAVVSSELKKEGWAVAGVVGAEKGEQVVVVSCASGGERVAKRCFLERERHHQGEREHCNGREDGRCVAAVVSVMEGWSPVRFSCEGERDDRADVGGERE